MDREESRNDKINSMEHLLGKEFKILNKGFIRVVDYMGDDNAIVQAARVSYGKGTKTKLDDISLIRYLMRNKHTTPFEMCEIKFHIKAPIFIARQWLRHRTASVNEISGRYSVMEDDYYIPDTDQIKQQSSSNKQGRGQVIDENIANEVSQSMETLSSNMFSSYYNFIDKYNLAKEISRIILPMNTYTQFYWKIDLHNLLHFLKLRLDTHAQYEIRAYAQQMLDILKIWVPATYGAFVDYQLNSHTFSKGEIDLIRASINKDKLLSIESNLSKRELDKFYEILDIKE